MRRRIVLTTIAVSVITLFLFVILVAWASATRIVVTQRDSARVDANRIGAGIDDRLARGRPVDAASLVGFVRADESVDITLPDGRRLELGARAQNQRIVVTSTSPGGATVTVHTAGDNLGTASMRIAGVLGAMALVATLAAALVARRLADSLVEPVRDLALVAARLGSGDPRPARRRYGIAELDAVAEVLDGSAQRIGEQLSTERQLAADVSHQLRTPLTALSMRLEEVIATDDPEVARSEATIALQQVERLSGVVDDLLAYARHPRSAQGAVDLDDVLAQQVDEWRGAFAAAGRSTLITGEPGLTAWVSPGALGQVVATLVENSLVHGAGTTVLRTRTSGRSVVIEVSDEGPGVPAELARTLFDRDVSGAAGSGLGLAVARAITEVEGGRLELIQARPAVFAVFLAASAPDEQPAGRDDAASVGGADGARQAVRAPG